MSNLKFFLIAAALFILYLIFKPPSASSIVANTIISPDRDRLELNGVIHQAHWGDAITLTGDLRYIGRAYDPYAAYITHDAVLTSGEFSDPEIVDIQPMRKGSTRWSARKKPQGSFVALHFIPLNATVLDALETLKEGDHVALTAREETDSSITGSDGSMMKLMHSNHKLLLLTSINKLSPQ